MGVALAVARLTEIEVYILYTVYYTYIYYTYNRGVYTIYCIGGTRSMGVALAVARLTEGKEPSTTRNHPPQLYQHSITPCNSQSPLAHIPTLHRSLQLAITPHYVTTPCKYATLTARLMNHNSSSDNSTNGHLH